MAARYAGMYNCSTLDSEPPTHQWSGVKFDLVSADVRDRHHVLASIHIP